MSELCVTGKQSPPSWQQIDPTKSVYRTVDTKHSNKNENIEENKQKPKIISNSNLAKNESESLKDGNDARITYLCFLTHYYLELQQGENAIKILEGVLQVFPHSLIATSQVKKVFRIIFIIIFHSRLYAIHFSSLIEFVGLHEILIRQ